MPEPDAQTTAVLSGCAEETAAALSESGERTPINLRMIDKEIDDWCCRAAPTNRSLSGSDFNAGTDVVIGDTPLAVVDQYVPQLVGVSGLIGLPTEVNLAIDLG